MADELTPTWLPTLKESPLEKRAWDTAPTRMYLQAFTLVALSSAIAIGLFGDEFWFMSQEFRLALAGIAGFYVGCGSGSFGKRLLVGFFATIVLGLRPPHFPNEPLQDLGLVVIATALAGLTAAIVLAWADWQKEALPRFAWFKLLLLVGMLAVLLAGANHRFAAMEPNAAFRQGAILAARGGVFALAVVLQLLPLRASTPLWMLPYFMVALFAFGLAPAADGWVRNFEGAHGLWETSNLYCLSLACVWVIGYPLHFALGALDIRLVDPCWKQSTPKRESHQEEFQRLAESRFSLH
ncbi:hypothetical protein [Blastopirellula marina]|uniref:Uncharacterized protein n=1 Tax=Blastopirellula marina TaxID=124 RepID=A0A2S8FWW1_9BACT|nr:hypothetical protein [Blastopirellula marina]PQO36672.1 hypothetical protein C5Y98_11815 [Blastopirellula marina]PTL44502.1 hypothetical protein C5Y97_11825 [Blastopirellula marina]